MQCAASCQVRGIAERMIGTDSVWQLSDNGAKLVHISEVLELAGLALAPRKGIEREALTTFELLSELLSKGWKCCVWQGKRGERPVAWSAEKENIIWVKRGQRRLGANYLVALLEAAEGKGKCKEVAHFQTEAFYVSAVRGTTDRSGLRKKGGEFDFVTEGRVMPHNESLEGVQNEGQEEGEAEPDSDDAQRSRTSGSNESSSSSSRSSRSSQTARSSERSSSSRSSSSSSSSSSLSADAAASNVTPAEARAAAAATVASASSSGVGGTGAGGDSDEQYLLTPHMTHMWKGFRFTQTYLKDGSVEGWEVRCYDDRHRTGKTMCRRRRCFASYGSPLECERRLKLWCLHAGSATGRLEHRDQPEVGIASLPSSRELEDLEPLAATAEAQPAPAQSRAKRPRTK